MLIQWSSPLPVLVLEKPLPEPDAVEEILVSANVTDVPPERHLLQIDDPQPCLLIQGESPVADPHAHAVDSVAFETF